MQNACEVTILMPCLNEAETLERCISKAKRFLSGAGIDGEVLIADNGSHDGSQAIAVAAAARVVDVPSRGYGSALMGGIRAARGRYVIMGDADDSYDFSDLGKFVERLRAGDELVMGNRFKGEVKPGAMPFLHRYLGNPVLTAIGRRFFKSPVGDFHCGLRGFARDAILGLELQSPGMEFASEMVVKATLHELRIAEVPITLYPDGRSRPPHLRTWRDGWRHLRFLLLYCPRWLFLYPGLALALAGLAVMIWLLPQARVIGPVTFDVHTLYYAALSVVIGYQSVQFWMFSTIYSLGDGITGAGAATRRILNLYSVEVGLIAGIILLLLGLGLGLYAFGSWERSDFGVLMPSRTLRYVVSSGTAILIGLQTIYGTFFTSILAVRAPRLDPPRNATVPDDNQRAVQRRRA
jgi:glycosyltransferase involved in cell wall biosynthesis